MSDTEPIPEIQPFNPVEMFKSLNGFDEIAIRKVMGEDIYAQAGVVDGEKQMPMSALRSLLFIAARRQGMKDVQAKNMALSVTVGDMDRIIIQPDPS